MTANFVGGIWMVPVIILSILGLHLGHSAMPLLKPSQVQRVVNSSVTLWCDIPTEFGAETVRWSVNSSTIPFLTYFPKDKITSPLNHDPRFLITDPEKLNISRVLKSDSGLYECRITSARPVDDVVCTFNITVTDGCRMSPYIPPLATTSDGCPPGDVLVYDQVCTFTCIAGFRLVGNESTKCQGNGQLSTGIPHCEEVTCAIGDLPPHLNDSSGACVTDAEVRYGETCHFECTTGYMLTGNGTIQIKCDMQDAPHYPECEVISEESMRLNGGYIALICISIVIVAVLSIFLLWKVSKGKNCRSKDRGNEQNPLLITTYGGFIDYLGRQIGESFAAINMILLKLEKAELRNIPKLSRMMFKENRASGKGSIPGAFLWYVAEVVRCIDRSNPGSGGDLITDIISSTEDMVSHGSKTTSSIVSLDRERGKGTKTYFEVVHRAFENLLVVLQKSIKDEKVVKERTTKVSIMMKTYFKENKQVEQIKEPASDESILPDWAESSDGANFFAKICLRNIDKCVSLHEKVRMRCNIIRILIDSTGQADDCDTNV